MLVFVKKNGRFDFNLDVDLVRVFGDFVGIFEASYELKTCDCAKIVSKLFGH